MNAREPFVLGEWTVDPPTGTLVGPAGQRRLTPKLTDLLVALVQRPGQVVTRDELLRDVWGERSAVSDEPLTRAVAELRKILGDVRTDPAYIETIPKRGYRVIAAVSAPGVVMPRPGPPPAAAGEGAALQDAVTAGVPPGRFFARRWRVAALALAAAGLVALAIVVVNRAPPGAATRSVGVAVLPFEDLSPAADRQYFADGVHEEIIARLAGVPGLRVSSHAAITAYAHAGKTPQQIARELGVDAVLQGTVRYADARVRVTAQLIDATGTDLWAENFDRELSLEGLFDMQAEIADQVTAGLTRSLAVGATQGDQPLPTASLPAYEAFLLGKYHYRRHQAGDVQIAIEQFQKAVDADGRFAVAWDWLAYAWLEAGVDLGWTTPAQAFPRARAAALRALELDPQMATSSAVIGFLRATYDWNWEAGLAELRRAVAAAPRESGTVWSYAYVLSLLGRHDEAIAQVRALAAAFPENGRLQAEVAERLIDAGRFREAARAANAALAGGAEPGQVRELLGVAAFGAGDLEAARAELERAVSLQLGSPSAIGRLAAVYARLGRPGEARELLAGLEARDPGERRNVANLARVYAALGERDRALALLEQGVGQRQRDVLAIGVDPFFATLREDPRFLRLLGRMGLDPGQPFETPVSSR